MSNPSGYMVMLLASNNQMRGNSLGRLDMPYRECHPYESLKCHMPVKSIAEDGDLVVRCCTDEREDAPRIWIGNKSANSISTKGNNPKNTRCRTTADVH